MTDRVAYWDAWNRRGGPKYPHEKVIQFCFRNFSSRTEREGKAALDLGCGAGVHTVFLADEGFRVTAVDISAEGVRQTRARLAERGLTADLRVQSLTNLDLPEQAFDLIVCVGVLDSAGPAAAGPGMRQVPDLLRPGGRGLFMFASDQDYRFQNGKEGDLYGYSRAEVDLLFAYGYTEVWIDRYSTTYRSGEYQESDWLVTVQK